MDFCSSNYKTLLILEPKKKQMKLRNTKWGVSWYYGLRSLIRQLKWYKTSEDFTCLDLMLTDVPRSFYNADVLETGISDFHQMTLTVMMKVFKKRQSRKVSYMS